MTPNVVASLDPSGQFVTEATPDMPYAQITAAQARLMALAAAHTFGPLGKRASLEREHGGRIDFAALEAGRVFYGHPAYEQNLPADFHPGFRKAAGPFYVVTLTNRGIPVLSVAVSAYNTDVTVENGQVTGFAPRHGTDFWMFGVGPDEQHDVPLSPERAAQVAAGLTGVKVAGPPQLQLLGIKQGVPQEARWRVRLERKVRVISGADGRPTETDEVFVGKNAQAMGAVMAPMSPDRYLDTMSGQWAEFRFLPTSPSRFVPLTLAPESKP